MKFFSYLIMTVVLSYRRYLIRRSSCEDEDGKERYNDGKKDDM